MVEPKGHDHRILQELLTIDSENFLLHGNNDFPRVIILGKLRNVERFASCSEFTWLMARLAWFHQHHVSTVSYSVWQIL